MQYVSLQHNSYGRIGHQFQCWMSPIILSEWFGLVYAHCPFERAPSSHPKYKMTEHIPLWEEHLNLGKDEVQCSDLADRDDIKIVDVNYGQNKYPGQSLIGEGFPCEAAKEIFGQGTDNVWYRCQRANRVRLFKVVEWQRAGLVPKDLRNRVIQRVRRKYWDCAHIEGIESYFDPAKVNVAIQIRRGDQSLPCHYRYVPIEYYQKLIRNLESAAPEKQFAFHIYSESKAVGKDFKAANIHFHWCDNKYPELFSVLHHLILADVLVVARSAFSWIASHVSKGVTLEEDGRWAYASPHSIITDMNGNFNKRLFAKKLNASR